MKIKETKFYCDRCQIIVSSSSSLDIVTSLNEESIAWSRLHVNIILRSGCHNDSTKEDADLCKRCVIDLLEDALKRVRTGERATAGVESASAGGW